jgi:hypothetical protein
VREAAARIQCANNLKQIALAFHNHHDAHDLLPSGGGRFDAPRTLVGGSPADARRQAWGWAYQILPHLEQQSLWQTAGDAAVAATPVKVYFCPSLRAPTVRAYSGGTRALIDYAGNGGTFGSLNYPGQGRPYNSGDGPLVTTGAGRVTLTGIPDGTSATLLVGEKWLNRNAAGTATTCNDDQGYTDGWDNDTIGFAVGSNGLFPPRRNADQDGCADYYYFGSAHHGGMQSAFCDGSVRTVRYSIAAAAFQSVLSATDGVPVSLDD